MATNISLQFHSNEKTHKTHKSDLPEKALLYIHYKAILHQEYHLLLVEDH